MNRIAVSVCLLATCVPALALEVADWTSATTATLGSVSINLSVVGIPPRSNPILFTGPVVSGTFGSGWFSGPVSLQEAVEVYGKPSDPTNRYTVTFSTPVTDLRIHLGSLASTMTFDQPITRLSGQSSFVVSGTTVTGAVNNAGLPTDANGTIGLNGTLNSISFTARGLPGVGAADGIALQIAATPSRTYGIFLGTTAPAAGGGFIQGAADANEMYQAFSRTFPGTSIQLIPGDSQNPISIAAVQSAFDQVRTKIRPGDKFVFYNASHGGTQTTGVESTASAGNEYLALGGQLTDDLLKSYLQGLGDSVEKWVLLEACHSGGFWGNNNPSDAGDLEKVKKVGFLAASREDKEAFADGTTGRGFFTSFVLEAMELRADGFARADANRDGSLSFAELSAWVLTARPQSAFAYEMAQGDLVPYSPDMWTAEAFSSADFQGNLFITNPTPVPEPSPIVLGAVGLLALAAYRQKQTIGERR